MRFLGGLALVWVVLGGLAWFFFGPAMQGMPGTVTQWVWWVAAGLPACILFMAALELLGAGFRNLPSLRQGNDYVEQRTQGKSLSGLRVLWYLLTTCIFLALLLGASWAVRTYL